MKGVFFQKKNRAYLQMAFLALFIMACKGRQDEIVQSKVAEAIVKVRQKKASECRQNMLAEAEQIVDSLLLQEAQSGLHDSLANAKPKKPPRPVPIPPIDSARVKPIFQ